MGKRIWTNEEKEYVQTHYPNTKSSVIAARIGRTVAAVTHQAYIQGVRKSAEYMKAELDRQGKRLQAMPTTHFKKGQKAWNKGIPMDPELKARLLPTMFQKGQKAHNRQPIGYERISSEGYLERRTEKGFVAVHRINWEKKHGKIPPRMCVVFRDGNPQNPVVENLELISREDHMRRNSVHNYPTELQNTFKLLSKLKKRIDEKQN